MLTKKRKYQLKGEAHAIKPSVLLGNKGLTPAVIDEINYALNAHELIKIKLTGVERAEKEGVINQVCLALDAHLIQLVGHNVTLYRKNPEPIVQIIKPAARINHAAKITHKKARYSRKSRL